MSVGTDCALVTLLISFGAGVEAPGCASACSEPVATGRLILGLSLMIYILPLFALSTRRRIRVIIGRFLAPPSAGRRPARRATLSRLMG